jgi:hypothetical protein
LKLDSVDQDAIGVRYATIFKGDQVSKTSSDDSKAELCPTARGLSLIEELSCPFSVYDLVSTSARARANIEAQLVLLPSNRGERSR